jgi:rare lipoprotein A
MLNPRAVICVAVVAALSGCGTTARREAPIPPTMEKDASGRYYLDDGPGDNPPADLDSIPDAMPKLEPLHRGATRPYNVMGRDYVPMTTLARYKARGTATWYGRRYHGKPTSSGEPYDMYAMTAAHTTLPIPSYARVTNLANGKSVIVRINDRGPFVGERLIDLSYTAAYKLGLVKEGSGLVEVETILPGDPVERIAAPPPASASVAQRDPRAAPREAAPVPQRESGPRPAPRETAPAAMPLAPAETPAAQIASTMPERAGRSTTSAPIVAAPVTTPPVASVAPESATPVAAVSQPPAPNGIYVQFGAFRSRENAETLLSRLKQQMAWLAARLQIHPREGLYRVHAGPYYNAAEAREIAARVGDMPGPRPVLLKW